MGRPGALTSEPEARRGGGGEAGNGTAGNAESLGDTWLAGRIYSLIQLDDFGIADKK